MKSKTWLLSILAFASVAVMPSGGSAGAFEAMPAQASAKLAPYKGKVIILDFWASWCPTCQKSIPWLESLQAKYGAGNFQIVGVNVDKKKEDADRIIAKLGMDLPVIFDSKGELPEALKVEGMPYSVIVDSSGQIVDRITGFNDSSKSRIEGQLQKLITGA
jgi:cytochrome c biogenesis protein CcmG/thiol:disulfide interchange protein DsbE